MRREFEQYFTIETAFIALTFAMIIYAIMTTLTLPHLSSEMNGIKAFELRTNGFSVEEAKEIIENLSYEGKQFYKKVHLPLSFLYPPLLLLFAYISYFCFSRWINIHELAIAVPILIVIFDYLENVGIYLMLNNYTNAFFVKIISTCTILKNISTLAFLLILALLTFFSSISKMLERI